MKWFRPSYRTRSVSPYLFIVLFGGTIHLFVAIYSFQQSYLMLLEELKRRVLNLPAMVTSPFIYSFNNDGVLDESQKMGKSRSPYWCVNSGGEMVIRDGYGSTILNELPSNDPWRIDYAQTNPLDTDNGRHPQNIFRLVTRNQWQNYDQEVYVRILKDNLSSSPNRNESNGIFLFNRYQDGDNLYYVGLRVDGSAIIKKKQGGKYQTLSQTTVLTGKPYHRSKNPSLLPKNEWIGLRSEAINLPDGSVYLSGWIDFGFTGQWHKVIEYTDTGRDYGPIISAAGYAGIRTDFMDVQFTHYKITSR